MVQNANWFSIKTFYASELYKINPNEDKINDNGRGIKLNKSENKTDALSETIEEKEIKQLLKCEDDKTKTNKMSNRQNQMMG